MLNLALRRGVVMLMSFLLVSALFADELVLEKQARDFSSTRYLTAQQQEEARQRNYLTGYGEAEFELEVPEPAWYELYAVGGRTHTLYLDGEFLYHGLFDSGVWEPRDRAHKVLNLPLQAGRHTLRFARTWHPGLELGKVLLVRSSDLPGLVRVELLKDYLAFRRGEDFPVRLTAARLPQAWRLTLRLTDDAGAATVWEQTREIPPGEGNYQEALRLPTDREGVFDFTVTDDQGRHLWRVIQFLVVDTAAAPAPPAELERELVQTISCAQEAPEYASGETRVVTSALGSYRESADEGVIERGMLASWYAYTLNLPSVQEPYLLEIDYPDDDERTFTYSLIENYMPGARALTHGLASGGIYPLSGQMQTTGMIFWPRQTDPRLQLRTWWSGQRAAAATIRVYRITGGFPVLVPPGEDGGREFGRYQEEPVRFVQHGARAEGNRWQNLWDPAERIGQISRYLGVNFWNPTIAIYGATMWPSQYLPSLDRDADGWAVGGEFTRKEPLAKDTLRLLLLTAEKYGLRLTGELFMPGGRAVAREYFEDRVGGDGNLDWERATDKPWLSLHRTGPGAPGGFRYNALHPGVQDWVADLVGELAHRYADSPAFAGLALRFMSWQFTGWQSLADLNWGYDDYTVARFEADTGLRVPVDPAAANRFQQRYDWLMANALEPWIEWRCEKTYEYHARLARILTDARSDLKLYLHLHGPTFGQDLDFPALERKGWTRLLRESGLDPARYRENPALVIRERRHYPPGIRGTRTREPQIRFGEIAGYYDPEPLQAAAEPLPGGGAVALHFDANSFESDLCRLADLGFAPSPPDADIHGAGLVFPAGRNFLERYAHNLADGNLTSITDGSHGYISWPPEQLREFTAEYRRLPAIGMQPLPGSGDPVAVWTGTREGRLYFYVVSRLWEPVHATLRFPAGARVRALRTGEAAPLDQGALRVDLDGFALRTFVSETGAAPAGLEVTVPPAVTETLRRQVQFAADLLSLREAEDTLIRLSVQDMERAAGKLAEAREALAAGRVWAARLALLHPRLVKVYEALDAWPPELLHRKAPPAPAAAWQAPDLRERLAPDSAAAEVVAAGEVAPPLAGEQVLTWGEGALRLQAEAPVANRYRFSFGYLSAPGFARPRFALGGRPLPDGEPHSVSETALWGRLSLLAPVALPRGIHTLSAQAADPAAGLFWVSLEPDYRDLVARDWLVIGPFPSEIPWAQLPTGIDTVYPPEEELDLAARYAGADGRTVNWQRPEEDAAYVDLYALTGVYSDRVSYAITTIRSPEERPAELRFGVDYWARLWLNGEQVFEVLEGHGAPAPAQFRIPVHLRAGENRLLVKINAGSRGNGFWLGLSDPGDLQVAPPGDPA